MECVFALNVPTVTRVVYYDIVVHSYIGMINLALLKFFFWGGWASVSLYDNSCCSSGVTITHSFFHGLPIRSNTKLPGSFQPRRRYYAMIVR